MQKHQLADNYTELQRGDKESSLQAPEGLPTHCPGLHWGNQTALAATKAGKAAVTDYI